MTLFAANRSSLFADVQQLGSIAVFFKHIDHEELQQLGVDVVLVFVADLDEHVLLAF